MADEEGSTSGGIRSYARNLTTRSQVNGYRFLLSRMDHAIVRRDIRMLHDPMRSQYRSLLVGLVFGILVLAGCGIWAYFSPNRLIKQEQDTFIFGHDSGARYVMVNGKLHPVLNAVSAWLIIGKKTPPVSVKETELGKFSRGPLVGIVGAPDSVMPSPPTKSEWSVCDTTMVGIGSRAQQENPPRSTKIPEYPEGSIELSIVEGAARGSVLPADSAFLVAYNNKNYLVYGDGKRAEIDLDPQVAANNAVMSAYQLTEYRKQDVTKQKRFPRQISDGLFNSLEELPPIVPPAIPHRGDPPPAALGVSNILVGTVVKSRGTNGEEQFYVIESTGYQSITKAMADLIRNSSDQIGTDIKVLQPSELNRLQTAHELDIDWYPPVPPKILDPKSSQVICYNWSKSKGDAQSKARLFLGTKVPVPANGDPVELASADGGETVDSQGVHHNNGIDKVYLQPGTGFFAQGVGVAPNNEKHGSIFYVADTGVRFGIQNLSDASALGLPASSAGDGSVGLPVPWSILGKLPQGPTLSRGDALVELDSAAPGNYPAPLFVPQQSPKQGG
ncbi:protein of unknown function DUF690 [Segniliparus rotundus DSM 44985]|uniref:Type VII secretion protein EccB n=1 Tax=Segniliparus rotundus (strain ATCC BAA-972 / CDC 1076 / CIP 108378 / DSM 44985 / JCM 13578) TaxID=640132 RepID=D6ZBH8_SEGRD|nr:type VII secretion protein EccB [Segniliparus rotundus]ADG98930.1 protein of unknown function DUF690 [Segniliparus rotundus DSM 44985]